ncbi:MAG: hypothetical protein HYS13_02415 [Planctomycetia bacterium]|nr:hypothetical protein [Planctomycetia bacterium]
MIRNSLSLSLSLSLLLSVSLGGSASRGNEEMTMLSSGRPQPPFRLTTAERDRQLRNLLPQIDDDELQKLFGDERLILYTDDEMPGAYQFRDGAFPGVHSPRYNISANDSEPYGNGNVEFPWGGPAGAHRSRSVETFKFLWLPLDDDGRPRPIVWFTETLPGDSEPSYGWLFPRGTIFGEVLLLRSPGGKSLPFEVRVRTRDADDWAVDAFRPFPTADDLAKRIRQLRPKWQDDEKLAALVEHLEKPRELAPKLLASVHPGRTVISQWMGEDELPEVGDDGLVEELLTKTKFTSAASTLWRRGTTGWHTHAATTKAAFHVVPAQYAAGFIDVERKSCLRCHDTVGRPVREFEAGRDWYGRIRGSDGIFSFHPFDPSCISDNGYQRGTTLRQPLVDAGLLERYDGTKHADGAYRRLRVN